MLYNASMKIQTPKIPKKYQPYGFQILHEDLDIIVGNKSPGVLTVAALWEREKTVHNALNIYVQKGNSRSKKRVYVVHRLDQATSGVLVFAKSEKVQFFLKDNWSETEKIYYAIVHGKLEQKKGFIESYLSEDDDYLMHSSSNSKTGKFARTEYEVVKENGRYSLVKVNLITGKKNQIRVHLSELGNPIVGDPKYGKSGDKCKDLMLHSYSLEINHPFTKERVCFEAPVPNYFQKLVDYSY